MRDRAQEIEAFYWLLIRVGVLAFGFLMMIGGGLMALTYLVEKLRTGTVAVGGQAHADSAMAVQVIGVPALVAVGGFFAVRKIRQWQAAQAKD